MLSCKYFVLENKIPGKKQVTCAEGCAKGTASEVCFGLRIPLWPLPAVINLALLGTPHRRSV